mgnify:CR=1 FL=1
MNKKCLAKNCKRTDVVAKGYCAAHYQRYREGRSLATPLRRQQSAPSNGLCTIGDCIKPHMARGYCSMHYMRWRLRGSATKPLSILRGSKTITDKRGYVWLLVPGHPMAYKYGRLLEHRYVMSEIIGRVLSDDEIVHHKNGIKSDNRPDNLELWLYNHPSSQRASDQVRWAKEILKRYG